jgi:hypothetical protein
MWLACLLLLLLYGFIEVHYTLGRRRWLVAAAALWLYAYAWRPWRRARLEAAQRDGRLLAGLRRGLRPQLNDHTMSSGAV